MSDCTRACVHVRVKTGPAKSDGENEYYVIINVEKSETGEIDADGIKFISKHEITTDIYPEDKGKIHTIVGGCISFFPLIVAIITIYYKFKGSKKITIIYIMLALVSLGLIVSGFVIYYTYDNKSANDPGIVILTVAGVIILAVFTRILFLIDFLV